MWQKIKKDWDACRIGILIILLLWIVTTLLGSGMCVFKAMWGMPCPGCGLTRSVLFILRGRFEEAWQMHPFGFAWMAFFGVFFIDRYLVRRKENIWKIMLVLICVGMFIRYVWLVIEGGLLENLLSAFL